jgi:hypothetical protein
MRWVEEEEEEEEEEERYVRTYIHEAHQIDNTIQG